ncbi:hypothetical protein [White-tailed deer poxvirus]|nr:hypothetical protein [White-tailed deer poxvirus]
MDNIITGKSFSYRDWDISEYFKNCLDDTVPSCTNVCSNFDNVIVSSNTISKLLIADIPKIDKSISCAYSDDKKSTVELNRVSRFGKLILLNNEKNVVYITGTNNNVVYVILTLMRNNDCDKGSCEIKILKDNDEDNISRLLDEQRFAIIQGNQDALVSGTNVLILILIFDEKNFPFIPLIRSISNNDVFISRHNRIHEEIPDKNWFKFYVELRHCYTTSLMLVIDGTVLYVGTDKDTHCLISKGRANKQEAIDDCHCCYNDVSLCVFDKRELLQKTICSSIRGGLHIIIKTIGNFSAGAVGIIPKFDYIKITMSAACIMLTKDDKLSGKTNIGSYIYGIAHR